MKNINQIYVDDYIGTLNHLFDNIDDNYVNELHDVVRFYQEKIPNNPLDYLMTRWQKSLQDQPDYSVYSDIKYLMETWACYFIYSRVYINNIVKKMPFLKEYKSFIDLGCGTGLTTTHLKQEFPNIRILGTQLKNTKQWEIAEWCSHEANYELVENTKKLNEIDVVFAFEYFEHFEKPIEHLYDVINDINPKMLIIANSFNTVGIGHFEKYLHENAIIDQKNISKLFNKNLRKLGYKKNPNVKFWNNKPSVWIK
jgi:2-polyprenyl-3-methyl-5-hydroxy-6-metoxy-1,4-benzoquinol methylase